MKLNSKSGATLAAAAATLFLAGAVVSTVSTPANAAAGQVHGRQRLQGPERLQGRGQCLQGPERLQGHTASRRLPRRQCAAMGAKFVKG